MANPIQDPQEIIAKAVKENRTSLDLSSMGMKVLAWGNQTLTTTGTPVPDK